MEITEVRVKLVERPSERLRAFCSVTMDGDFVIRDLKIIGGANGAFVAMPSRKLADRCPRCGCKNHLRAKFCNECGAKLNESRAPKDSQGRAKLHADVAHPINAACRERIQTAVIKAYEGELERAKAPDYEPPTFDDLDEEFVEEEEVVEPAAPPKSAKPSGDSGDRDQRDDRDQRGDRDQRDDGFGDYNSLIADLKRDAATREEKRRQRQGGPGLPRFDEEPRDARAAESGQASERPRPVPKRGTPSAPPVPAASRDTTPAQPVPAASRDTTPAQPAPAASRDKTPAPARDRRRESDRAAPPSSPSPEPAPEPAKPDGANEEGFGAGLS